MHPRHLVVALSQVAILVEQTQLFVGRQFHVNRLFDIKAPDSFRTVDDKRAITLFACSQSFLSTLAFCDVLNHGEAIEWVSTFTSNQECGYIQPRQLTILFDKAFLDPVTRNLAAKESVSEVSITDDIVGMSNVD